MRIGIDARLWNESGVGRYTRNLIRELQLLDKENDYILFVLQKDSKNIKQQVLSANFQTKEANIKWHTINEQIKLPSILYKENLDVMHFPYFSAPVFYRKPFVITIHDLIINHFDTGEASTWPLPLYKIKRIAYQFIINRVAKNAKKIITVSQSTKSEILDHLKIADKSKIIVTYEGIDENIRQTENQALIRLKHSVKPPFLLYVGNAYPHKNLERLITSFIKVLSNNEALKLSLVLVGKEDYFYKRLKKSVEDTRFKNSIVFYGEANDEELSALYRSADALILPSLMEGFGLPVVEAMANKCLVLASDIPSLREICNNAAFYFDPYNVKDISEKILFVISNKKHDSLEEKIKTGFERSKKFSWEKMAKETLRVYQEYK